MFYVCWLISKANSAIFLIASLSNFSSMSSVFRRFCCCISKLYYGSVRILSNSAREIGFRPTLIGKRPSNSGMRSSTLDIEKEPLAIKRIWSVLMSPYFVFTKVPSIKGRRSRCTPSVETPLPVLMMPSGVANLSISSKKIIPSSYTFLRASLLMSTLEYINFNLS